MQKLLIGLYEFDGPYSIDVEPQSEPGVLAILRHSEGKLELLQLKATENVNASWRRMRAWHANWKPHELSMAIHYMPGLSRGEAKRVRSDILDELEMAAA